MSDLRDARLGWPKPVQVTMATIESYVDLVGRDGTMTELRRRARTQRASPPRFLSDLRLPTLEFSTPGDEEAAPTLSGWVFPDVRGDEQRSRDAERRRPSLEVRIAIPEHFREGPPVLRTLEAPELEEKYAFFPAVLLVRRRVQNIDGWASIFLFVLNRRCSFQERLAFVESNTKALRPWVRATEGRPKPLESDFLFLESPRMRRERTTMDSEEMGLAIGYQLLRAGLLKDREAQRLHQRMELWLGTLAIRTRLESAVPAVARQLKSALPAFRAPAPGSLYRYALVALRRQIVRVDSVGVVGRRQNCVEGATSAGEQEVGWRETTDRLWAAIDRLSPDVQRAIELHVLEGESASQVAGSLGLDVVAAKRLVEQGLRQLREFLGETAREILEG